MSTFDPPSVEENSMRTGWADVNGYDSLKTVADSAAAVGTDNTKVAR
jgi:hypothetical protein